MSALHFDPVAVGKRPRGYQLSCLDSWPCSMLIPCLRAAPRGVYPFRHRGLRFHLAAASQLIRQLELRLNQGTPVGERGKLRQVP